MSAPNFVKSVEILKFLAELCAQKNEINSAIEAYKKALEVRYKYYRLEVLFK